MKKKAKTYWRGNTGEKSAPVRKFKTAKGDCRFWLVKIGSEECLKLRYEKRGLCIDCEQLKNE